MLQAGSPLVSLLQLVCEPLPFMWIVNTQINGYFKVQLRCFVANLNIDGYTRFCANFWRDKMRLCYFSPFLQVCLSLFQTSFHFLQGLLISILNEKVRVEKRKLSWSSAKFKTPINQDKKKKRQNWNLNFGENWLCLGLGRTTCQLWAFYRSSKATIGSAANRLFDFSPRCNCTVYIGYRE